ncbi:unnamed protein product [Effrenium voratum]|nr:unnamed protein product [Effrenium voratum]
MPRGHGRRRRKEVEENSMEAQERAQRTVIFAKTKMCKFHILGACTKGAGCKFAHQKEELCDLPDLGCTKLCKQLISTGCCDDPNCRYAHNRSELKEIPGLPSPLLDQLRETEAARLADAAKAAVKAAAESNDAQRQRSNEDIQQQLLSKMKQLEQSSGASQASRAQEPPAATMPGFALQAVPTTALSPELAAQLFPNLQMGGAILSPASLDAGFLISLQNAVAQTQAIPWAIAGQPAPVAPVAPLQSQMPKRPEPAKAPAKAPVKAVKTDRLHNAKKVLSLASELPKPRHMAQDPQALATQVQQHLQYQLQREQEIQRQLRTQLTHQPPQEDAKATAPRQTQDERMVPRDPVAAQGEESADGINAVRSGLADEETAVSSYQRINTWSGGLNELQEELLDDPVLELGPLEKVEQSQLPIGLESFQQMLQTVAGSMSIPPIPAPAKETRGLHCVPENKRLTGMGRQLSECSETSITSTDTPTRTEKRHQDTPLTLNGRKVSASDSRGSSPFSAVHEEDEEAEDTPSPRKDQKDGRGARVHHPSSKLSQPGHAHLCVVEELTDADHSPTSPNTKLNQDFGAIVKNTFLELPSDEEEPKRLRMVHTAAGRLDSMGGLPSNPSFETLA